VLPDEASGRKVVTVGQETVTVQACLPPGREGMAHVFAFMQGICGVRAASRLPAGRQGTSFIGARKLSPVTKLLEGTGAVSRYNVCRSQIPIAIGIITVQELSCVQLRESGCKGH
jgi:hypothetical protein